LRKKRLVRKWRWVRLDRLLTETLRSSVERRGKSFDGLVLRTIGIIYFSFIYTISNSNPLPSPDWFPSIRIIGRARRHFLDRDLKLSLSLSTRSRMRPAWINESFINRMNLKVPQLPPSSRSLTFPYSSPLRPGSQRLSPRTSRIRPSHPQLPHSAEARSC